MRRGHDAPVSGTTIQLRTTGRSEVVPGGGSFTKVIEAHTDSGITAVAKFMLGQDGGRKS